MQTIQVNTNPNLVQERKSKLNDSHLAKLERELELSVYEQSYYEFYKVAFAQLHPGQPYDDNWHAKYLCDLLQKETERIIRKEKRVKDIIINVPFRSSKSLIATVIWPVWCWTKDPSLKFITTSFSGNLAIEHSSRSRDLIFSPWFQRLYGKRVVMKPDAQAKGHYETMSTGIRKAVGSGGQITGSGADIILCLRGDQLVMTDRGEIAIKDIVENKLEVEVLTFNHTTGNKKFKKIENYSKSPGRRLVKIKLKNGKEIICTEDHEIWIKGKRYVQAKDLKKGDRVKRLREKKNGKKA